MLQHSSIRRSRLRKAAGILLFVCLLYALLLIPDPIPPVQTGAGKQPFLWARDAYWAALEKEFQQSRSLGCNGLAKQIEASLAEIGKSLEFLATTNVPPTAPVFATLETNVFHLGPMMGACPERLPEFLQTFARMRSLIKRQSEHWPVDLPETREQLYRSLYGGRAAVEEAMLQAPREKLSALLLGDDEPSVAPGAVIQGVMLHSGDILVSRGGAASSALIARGNDFPGNFSHVALLHVDEDSKKASVIEAHIESGVGVRSMDAYLAETKLRVMVLRPRRDLRALADDPTVPHRAAARALRGSSSSMHRIPYDFAMDTRDHSKMFCSEVAAAAYQPFDMRLWASMSQLSGPGVTRWLSALGVRHFETEEPADLEYDPQLHVVAEWRDPETLFKDHVDNAVIDVLLEGAERGDRLNYNMWKLPPARLAKGWSWLKNRFGKVGVIPEGMSATTALRVDALTKMHNAIYSRVIESAEKFKKERGYVPPYWELVRMAREAKGGP
jgi:hypothetical protein